MFDYNPNEVTFGIYEPSLKPIRVIRRITILSAIFYTAIVFYIWYFLPESGTYTEFDLISKIWLIWIMIEIIICWIILFII